VGVASRAEQREESSREEGVNGPSKPFGIHSLWLVSGADPSPRKDVVSIFDSWRVVSTYNVQRMQYKSASATAWLL
jgi:hypothetical protein